MLFGPEVIPIFMLFFALHQLGHLAGAWFLGLPIPKLKLSSQPLPHPYAIALRTNERPKQLAYVLSGVAVSVLLFVIGTAVGFLQFKSLYFALVLILLMDSNPFYSDTLLAISLAKVKMSGLAGRKNWKQQYQQQFSTQLYTPRWYAYFIIWAVMAIVLLSPQLLQSIIFTN